jgi:hypothetical protein
MEKQANGGSSPVPPEKPTKDDEEDFDAKQIPGCAGAKFPACRFWRSGYQTGEPEEVANRHDQIALLWITAGFG